MAGPASVDPAVPAQAFLPRVVRPEGNAERGSRRKGSDREKRNVGATGKAQNHDTAARGKTRPKRQKNQQREKTGKREENRTKRKEKRENERVKSEVKESEVKMEGGKNQERGVKCKGEAMTRQIVKMRR